MQIRQIRNATIVLEYGGLTFLIDPYLGEKGAYPPVRNTANPVNNPTVGLPVAVEDLVATKFDAVIITHLHPDHFDAAAIKALPKDANVIAQSDEDAETIRKEGFVSVQAIDRVSRIGDVRLARTRGQHGTGEIGRLMGKVSGVVFEHPDEKTLYVAGDTIWCGDVEEAILAHRPEVIVVNGGSAQFLQGDPITMGKEDIRRTHSAAPQATIIVSHMEAVNHCFLSRRELTGFIEEMGLAAHILVPADGETIIR
ncbi:MBL fold metallo-hydrolase [Paenibacillus sp. GCM10023248]|uniref:MBL fold metallo-hydrolase n=1 Tax=Bacillales TaxID=1385 RepID=UPI0023789CBB|nr:MULTISPECIES: MBL fold metallo-hydrolase [Bacillales]MDD9271635.1 MBL fold metallo-hydrolase [Paenibacillus sp. MAHUQ-63]MDR6884004.1 L-ascorbate metabolism protein UlaG (beta-lactamase superfamily) [Bacillus sp. 3255]